MSSVDAPVLGRMLRPLAAKFRGELLEAVATMEADAAEEDRYHELADKNAEGTISSDERRELESIVSANMLLSTLRLEARATIEKHGA